MAPPMPQWQPIATAPADSDLRLAVLDDSGEHALIFPCRRTPTGWANATTGARIHINPTHWKPWSEHNEQA
jgi:hypothetical protein